MVTLNLSSNPGLRGTIPTTFGRWVPPAYSRPLSPVNQRSVSLAVCMPKPSVWPQLQGHLPADRHLQWATSQSAAH